MNRDEERERRQREQEERARMRRRPLPDRKPDLRWLERISTWIAVAIAAAGVLLVLLYMALT